MKIEKPVHEGELQVQERAGLRREAGRNAVVMKDSIVKGALPFIGRKPMVVVGSLDAENNIWASVLSAKPGFIQAGSEKLIAFDLSKSIQSPLDPFWKNIEARPSMSLRHADDLALMEASEKKKAGSWRWKCLKAFRTARNTSSEDG